MDFELYKKVPDLVSAWERNDSKVDGYIYGQVRKFEKLKRMDTAMHALIIAMCLSFAVMACMSYKPESQIVTILCFVVISVLLYLGNILDVNKSAAFKKTLENLQRFHNPFCILYDHNEGLSSLSVENVKKRLMLLAGDVVQCEVGDAAAAKVRRNVDTASAYSHTQLALSTFNKVFNAARSFGRYYGITTKEEMLESVRSQMKE